MLEYAESRVGNRAEHAYPGAGRQSCLAALPDAFAGALNYAAGCRGAAV